MKKQLSFFNIQLFDSHTNLNFLPQTSRLSFPTTLWHHAGNCQIITYCSVTLTAKIYLWWFPAWCVTFRQNLHMPGISVILFTVFMLNFMHHCWKNIPSQRVQVIYPSSQLYDDTIDQSGRTAHHPLPLLTHYHHCYPMSTCTVITSLWAPHLSPIALRPYNTDSQVWWTYDGDNASQDASQGPSLHCLCCFYLVVCLLAFDLWLPVLVTVRIRTAMQLYSTMTLGNIVRRIILSNILILYSLTAVCCHSFSTHAAGSIVRGHMYISVPGAYNT
jgi:hypothetical protein